jgi:hypothetical protein
MTHKDPITGCMVADLFEVITPDQFMGIMQDMDSEDRKQENDIMENKKLFFDILVEYGKLESKFSGEDFHILDVERILCVRFGSRFKGSELEIIAKITAVIDGAFKNGLVWYKHMSWEGSFYESPDSDEELVWLRCGECTQEMMYACHRCPELHTDKLNGKLNGKLKEA